MDRMMPSENKVLLDVALQQHVDQTRVASVSSVTISMPSDTNTTHPVHTTTQQQQQQQGMQSRKNSNTPQFAQQITTNTASTTATASMATGTRYMPVASLYPPGTYTHSNLPTQFSTALNTTGKGPSYVLDSQLHNLATSNLANTNLASSQLYNSNMANSSRGGPSPLYTNIPAPSKSNRSVCEEENYYALSENKISGQSFTPTQTQGYNSSQNYNNATQIHKNAGYDKKEQNSSPKPTLPQDYPLSKDCNTAKGFKTSNEYNYSKDYKNAAKDHNSTRGNPSFPIASSGLEYNKDSEGTTALSGKSVRSNDLQKYILLSPALGPKPVLLSPMYDKVEKGEARFVIVPMEIEATDRRSSPLLPSACCPILPAASSPLLAIEDFTSCQMLQQEAKALVSRTVEEEGERSLHKTQDTAMQMMIHSRQDTDKRSPIPICVSLQPNNLMPGNRGPPNMSRDQHMPDLLYNNKVGNSI